MSSDRQLKIAFTKFNRLYWDGALPETTVLIWEPTPKCDGVTCPIFELADNCFIIKMDPALKGEPCWWRIVLLHEMCHVAIWRQHPKHLHGKVFIDEKDRVYALGALDKLW